MVNDEIDNIDAIPIIKEMTILNDGKQFMVRIPKEVVDFFKIEKGDTFVFNIKIQKDSSINTFEVKKMSEYSIEQMKQYLKEEDKTLYEQQFEYIKKLLLDSKQLGEMNPNLNLKIIISNVINKYNLSNDDAMKLIGEVISDLD